MAELLQSIESLELFFADLVENLVGLQSENVLLQNRQYGQPSYDDSLVNSAYVKISPELDERSIYKFQDFSYNEEEDNFTLTTKSTRTLTLSVIFYGPDCYENCFRFNEKMYFNSTKILLEKNYLSLVPDRTNGPTRINEQHNGQWFSRCDILLRFYNGVVIEETVERIKDVDIRLEVDQ